ncbi:MAG TPA: histidinol-phosphatase [Myxococcaceae bacterium]|nr:histidinol-phosphatase [Myxococcaceae bacterium]
MSETRSWMEAAEAVARVAGEVALRHFHRGVTVETKGDGTPVSVADRAAEEAARRWLEKHCPEDGILGEELGTTRPEARRRWILDPIDGTKTFVRRVPLWGTLVALAEGERVFAGAAYFPAVDEFLVAAEGGGCFWNGKRTRVSEVSRLADAALMMSDARLGTAAQLRGVQALSAQAGLVRTWGDCYGYLLVATGRAEVMVDPVMAPWDAAALQPIIEEAGGIFTDWGGRRTSFGGSVIATNARVAAEARAALGAER